MSRSTLALCLLATMASGCAQPRPKPPQLFSFHVSSDPGKPLAGVHLLRDGKVLATSNGTGVASFATDGRDGETFDVAVECPTGFQSPSQPVSVLVRRLANPNAVAEYDARCLPRTRTIAVAVKGQRGHRLRVMQLGQEIGRTDESGVATVLVHVGPQEDFALSLDTTAREDAALRPESPAATFRVKDRDEVMVFDPHFTEIKKPTPQRKRRPMAVPSGPSLPIRIQ